MRTTRAVLNTEVQHVESHLSQRSGSRCAGQTRTYNNDVKLALVGRVNQLLMILVVRPLLLQRSLRNLRHLRRDYLGAFLARRSHGFCSSLSSFACGFHRLGSGSNSLFYLGAFSNFLCARFDLLGSSLSYFRSLIYSYFSHLFRCLSSFGCHLLGSVQYFFFLCHILFLFMFNKL